MRNADTPRQSRKRRLAVILLLLSAAAPAQGLKLEPVDEGARDASWTSFKARLLNAVAQRDRKFITGILHPSVRSGLDGGRGVAEFRRQWGLDADATPFWQELATVLYLGSAWNRPAKGPAELCAPYVAVKWPQDVDAFRGGAIVARDVLVKSAPTGDAATLARLSYDLVEVADWEVSDQAADARQKWVRIRMGEADGYVPEEQIRSPIEHAACFARSDGRWRMTGFGPGSGK